MKLRIDEEVCTGHGRCYSLVPELFESDDYGHGLVVVPAPGEDLRDRARLAEQNCPERAITLEHD
jgi:ferredoxin